MNFRYIIRILEWQHFLGFKRFPFDPYNPIGYLVAIFLEYIMLGFNLFIVSCTLALGIGAFWFAISLTKETQCMLHAIDAEAKSRKARSKDLKTLFSKYINNHGIMKQFSSIFQCSKCWNMIVRLFQGGTWFLGYISTYNSVALHVEPDSDFFRYANYSSGSSWVTVLLEIDYFIMNRNWQIKIGSVSMDLNRIIFSCITETSWLRYKMPLWMG